MTKILQNYQLLNRNFHRRLCFFCQFYVLKYLFKQIVELDVPKENRDEARELIRKLVYATGEDVYRSIKQHLFDTANYAFKEYFEKN